MRGGRPTLGPGHKTIDTEGALPAPLAASGGQVLVLTFVFVFLFSNFSVFPGFPAFSPYKAPTLELISR